MIPTSSTTAPYRHMRRVEPWRRDYPGISAARSQLWIPRPALASCVRAVMSRDTRGVALDDRQRYNHFPAVPTCSITWFLSGDGQAVDWAGTAPGQPFPRISFSGPYLHPSLNWSPGPIHGMMLMLMPDAVSLLTGVDPSAFLDRAVPVEEVFDDAWLEFCAAVYAAADDEQRIQRIEAFLLPRWRQARPRSLTGGWLLGDWTRGLALRAATAGFGRSPRQVERRIKQWTGLTLRELRSLGRAEQAFFESVAAHQAGNVNWSELADASGYADQSHLCRQIRRVTGFAPAELSRLVSHEESFWVYRLWGFSSDESE